MTLLDTRQPQDEDAAAHAQRRTGAKGQAWLTTELAVLREHHPAGGAARVHALLPHRTLAAIREKAAGQGVRAPRLGTLGHRFERRWPRRDDIDMAIREGYVHATQRGDIKRLAERLGRPADWVQRRAAGMGLTRTNRTRLDCWSAAELEILDTYAAARLEVIAAKLAKAGFKRTPTAVGIVLRRRKMDRTDPDVWSATQLGPLMGVNPKTVADWIDRRGLKAKKLGQGVTTRYLVHRRELRRWISGNHNYIDPRRLDWAWFCELMFRSTTA
jgi:hypothetical protein